MSAPRKLQLWLDERERDVLLHAIRHLQTGCEISDNGAAHRAKRIAVVQLRALDAKISGKAAAEALVRSVKTQEAA